MKKEQARNDGSADIRLQKAGKWQSPPQDGGISDKTLGGALRSWRHGALGTLGFQYFYVGRRGVGIGQCLMGLFVWVLLIKCFFEDEKLSSKLLVAAFFACLLTAISVSNYYKIKKGKLADNLGRNVTNQVSG